jgi:hypothetical protein
MAADMAERTLPEAGMAVGMALGTVVGTEVRTLPEEDMAEGTAEDKELGMEEDKVLDMVHSKVEELVHNMEPVRNTKVGNTIFSYSIRRCQRQRCCN